MAYFKPYIDVEGIHIPTYEDIRDYMIEAYKSIFGADVYLGEETPDYQMLSVFSKMLDDFQALAVDAYNARNPYYAGGNSLDILVELAGIIRRPATASTAVLTLTGISGTTVSAGSKAIDESGNLWTISDDASIPASGSVTASASCDTLGAIAAPAGTISGIYTPVTGWSGVTNAAAAETGLNVETDDELRTRFAKSHADIGSGLLDAIISGLLKVPGVTFADALHNDTNSTDANGIPAHSICAVVSGGTDQDVADAVYDLKAPGIGTYGTTSRTVVDSQGRSNTVSFTRPTSVTVTVNISLTPLAGYDGDITKTQIRQAIMDDINSLGIGKSWSVTMAYKDIYSAFPDVPFAITSISATNTHGTSSSLMQCNYNEILVTDATHVVITDS